MLMVHFVNDIFLSEVWISEVLWSLFVSCVLVDVYGLVQIFNWITIHSRHSTTHEMTHFLLVCDFSALPTKELLAYLLPPNELMVNSPDDPSVTMAEMEDYILDFLIVSSEIVASSADFLRFFLFHYFLLGWTLCWFIKLSILRLAASWDLRIFSQWGLTKSLNHFFEGYVPWNSNPLLS